MRVLHIVKTAEGAGWAALQAEQLRKLGVEVHVALPTNTGGRCQRELEALAQSCGVAGRIDFRGQVPAGQLIRDALDECDLFVLPSRTEGLPRAMIEAMARGLPCIGTAVGGIPELLEPEELVPPGDAVALARKIARVLENSDQMTAMSARNLAKANRFSEDVLRPKRLAFLTHLRGVTAEWQSRH